MKRTLSKALISCFIIVCSLIASAQKPIYGIFGGAQITKAKYKIQEENQSTFFVPGMQAGLTMKIPFENNLYFGPSIYYSHKGYKVDFDLPSFPPSVDAVNNRTSLHTIELAPLLHLDLSSNPSHFFIKFGPAIDFAIAGKEKFDTKNKEHVEQPMKFSFSNYYGRFTAQGILHLGYETASGLFVFAHYGEGMGSLSNAENGPTIKHRIAGLSLGWYFHKNPNLIDTRVKE